MCHQMKSACAKLSREQIKNVFGVSVCKGKMLRFDFFVQIHVLISCFRAKNIKAIIMHDFTNLSCLMRKPAICICETKGADQLCSYCKADQCLVFATRIVQVPFFLNPKFVASSHLLCLYRPVCVGPGQNYCWFSHEVAPLSVFPSQKY